MFENIMQITFLQNRILDYLVFFSILLVGILTIRIFRHLVLSRLRAWAEKTATDIDDFLIQGFEKTLLPILYFGIFYLSTRSLTLN
ncbi:MAG TPA: mechanosensitive ion channel family protein, partial [Nitrospirae bacterium]|nr:mechanosensitive ion channel family protein [Nitrospirota bacterium]